MRIDYQGNVGIGTNGGTIVSKLHVNTASATASYITSGNTNNGIMMGVDANGIGQLLSYGNNAITFGAYNTGSGTTERARIDSAGQLLLGTAANLGYVGKIGVKYTGGSSQYGIVLQPTTDTTNAIQFMNVAGSSVGSISQTTTATSYNTSSDYRLKYNVQPMQSALDVVMRLKPVTYQWKSDDSIAQGFIAHELAEVIPLAVTGEKDAETEDGNPIYQAIDTSKIVAHLVAALQELKREFDEYKASHQ
jgi:hypothetical protein